VFGFFAIAFNSKDVRILGVGFWIIIANYCIDPGYWFLSGFFAIIACYSIGVRYWLVGFWIIIACYGIVPGYWFCQFFKGIRFLPFVGFGGSDCFDFSTVTF